MLRWMAAKNTAEMMMAQTGLILLASRPRSTMPRQSHSSKNGAKTQAIRKLIQTLSPDRSIFILSATSSGIWGRSVPIASPQKAAAMVATITIRTQSAPPSGLKWLLSSFRPSNVKLLLRLRTLEKIIGMTNISG